MLSCFILIFLSLFQGDVSETVILTPSVVDVTANRSAILTCTLNTSGTGKNVSWGRSRELHISWAYTILTDTGCIGTSFLQAPNQYLSTCYGNKSFAVTILKVDETQHGMKWRCRISSPEITSNATIIKVKVPVKKVTIISSGTTTMKEHEFYSFTCKTSYSRPTPTVNWFLSLAGHTIEINATYRDIVTSNETEFESVTSVLNISLKREKDGAKLFCNGSNGIGKEISSRKIYMNITYAPDRGPTIQGLVNGSTYTIKENTLGNLSCSIPVANPLPHLFWNCSGANIPSKIENQVVKLNLQWRTKRDEDEICVCNSTHSLAGIQTAMVKIIVLYPPDIPKISVSTEKGDKTTATEMINITETTTVYLECFSKSRPKPSYTWFVNRTSSTDENVFNLTNITRSDAGNYACHVHNLMNTTSGTATPGNNSSSMLLNVLYPADVGSLNKTSLNEASPLNITCPVIPGNPSSTVIFWTRESDDKRWNSSQLIIRNVTRADDTFYTCTVFNEMIPTVGNVTKKERSSKFHLTVFYSAAIKIFSLIGEESKEKYFVVNETENVSFICTVDANPASDITIVNPQREQIETLHNINNVSYTLQNVSYENAGEYKCTSRNNYTFDDNSSSELILIVRCPPRPSTDETNDEKIATALHVEVMLQFTARNYLDEQNKTIFKWFKDNVSIGSDNRKFEISLNGLQSNLSIKNITKTEFGKYEVRVFNSVGNFTKGYKVMAKDMPEAPKDFAYINNSITDSSVSLKWMPGFNGGYPQTFILLYKRISGQYWQNKSIKDTGKRHVKYTLSGLFSVMEYQVKTFARNIVGDSNYTELLQFRTKAPVKKPTESNSSSMTGIVAGSVSLCVVTVTIIIVVVLIYRKRNNKETRREYQNVPFSGNQNTSQRRRASLHMQETLFEGLQEIDDVPIITKERTEYCNSPEMIDKIDRIKVTELFSYVSDRSEESFEADYQKLPTELQKPCTFARKPENIALNRYNGIYPYDHSRVKLHGQPDFFINACYIDGYKRSKAYIASLGPTAKTTSDFSAFWKMIWYERADVIVMLTNLREPSGMKCEKYWPEGCASISYGDVSVSSKATECFAEYTIRTFSVSKDDQHRSLTHLHYTAWPDKTVPEDVTSLIEFRQRVKTTPTSSDGPIVVHCSAGIGRTGTLIALDRLIEEGQDKGSLNVFECVDNMREQRVKMVQTFEQYMYIYKSLVNALTFDCDTIPVETFNEYVDATNNNMYSVMFQQLRQSVETDCKADLEARSKNEKLKNKNRRGADIPGNRFRAMLYLNRTDEGSEYINAIYINSFVKKDYFIAAQSPLPCTVADFITMVYQEDCSCIATMEDLKDPGMTVGQYLPDDKKTLTAGNFKVSSSRLETKHNYVVRKMKIKYSGKIDSGEKTIYHFQYTKWMTGHDTPMDAREFVQFVNEVKVYANELGEERSHVIVHCLKANERSGLFCALAILMEKIKLERQVNVLNTLRHLRTRRQTAITSMDQLKFCYQATSAYIKMNMLG